MCPETDILLVILFRWSDIYYIPRQFFQDFTDLANIFYAFDSFHEVAVPTMVNIIDWTHRLTPFHSVIARIGNCWGGCCAGGAKPLDIKQNRCGHRIDLAVDAVRNSLIELLELEATHLSKSSSN